MHSTISLILFFQWCFKSTPVSLSSERFLQLLWEFSSDRGRQALFLHPLQARKFIWSEWRLTVIAATVRIALVDILDLSEVDIPAGGVYIPRSGLGLRMVKELDLQLALGMNERRKTGSLLSLIHI